MASGKKVLVYGGKGALGSVIVDFFKKNNFWTVSVDLIANDSADANVLVDGAQSWTEQEDAVLTGVSGCLKDAKLDAVLCVAGGWAGGNAGGADTVKNTELMVRQSVCSSIISATIAAKFLKPAGLLQLTGAAPATNGTPGMLGYGLAKAAVHQLTASLALDGSGLPEGSCVVAILPVTLDTPMNRKWMPQADHSTWTPLEFVAETLHKWTTEAASRPESGSLLKLETSAGHTKIAKI